MTHPHQEMTDRALRYRNYATELEFIAALPNRRITRMNLLNTARDYERMASAAEAMARSKENLHSQEPKT